MSNITFPPRSPAKKFLSFTLLVLFLLSINSSVVVASARISPIAVLRVQTRSDKIAEARRLADESIQLQKQGRYDEAILVVERWLAIVESVFGPADPNVAIALNNLSALYEDKGDYIKAEPPLRRALAIVERALGPNHQDVATNLNNLGALYYEQGDYGKAEPLYQRALAISEKLVGPQHPLVAKTLNNLATLYTSAGEYVKAEPLHQRAIAIYEKSIGAEHPDFARSLNNLALHYRERSDYAKAEALYQRALALREKALGPQHFEVAQSLNNLAALYQALGSYAKAELLFGRALSIDEKSLGASHPVVGTRLNNLAALYFDKGEFARAEPLYLRALPIYEKALGGEHPQFATTLNNLAELYRSLGNYAKALPLFQRAIAVHEKSLGPNHPDLATALNNLALLHEAQGSTAKAVALRTRSTNISEHNIAPNLTIGSERQKLLLLAGYYSETSGVISLHMRSAPRDLAALRLALTTVLRRKGRALDAMVESSSALRLRLDPEQRAPLDQLVKLRANLATLTLAGPRKKSPERYRAELSELEQQIETLEDRVSRLSSQYRAQSQPVTLDAVQAVIPPDAMLVEFVSFDPYDAKQNRWEPRRYAAYVLGNRGQPTAVDLGPAARIDATSDELRAVLGKVENKSLGDVERDVKPKARSLDQQVMQPIRKLLGGKQKLLLSPDRTLNLIPFGALVDERNKYLIESYSITYLTTGRDLLRFQTRTESKQGAVVFANPDFGEYEKSGSARALDVKAAEKNAAKGNVVLQQNAEPAIDLSRAVFSPLPGTAAEARELKTIFPELKVWAERQATKKALMQVNAPAVLHIATHGFFLDDAVVSAATARSRGLFIRSDRPGEITPPEFLVEDPLLRSGLALAGANRRSGGDDNGILTAKEAAGLNLWGTRLVVLSACNTGVGQITNGEGVYGLRRALVLAGADTQVMSLWSVSDEGTRDLMIGYYRSLKAGAGRGEALRQVQLKMLSSENYKHPYYWASFIQSGEWASMDGKR